MCNGIEVSEFRLFHKSLAVFLRCEQVTSIVYELILEKSYRIRMSLLK